MYLSLNLKSSLELKSRYLKPNWQKTVFKGRQGRETDITFLHRIIHIVQRLLMANMLLGIIKIVI